MHAKHTALHIKLTARFSPELIRKWEMIVASWEVDPSKKNPYDEPDTGKLIAFLM
jgi:hypothetical protein